MTEKHLHILQSVSVRWFNACAYYGITLSQALQQAGHTVTVSAPVLSPAYERAQSQGLKILDLPPLGNTNPFTYFSALRTCRSFAISARVDMVNTINGSDHTFWTAALAGTGIPIVRTFCNRIMKSASPLKRFLMRYTSGTITSCIPLRNRCAELYKIPLSEIPVINGGVDTDIFAPGCMGNGLRNAYGIPEKAVVFGIIGRFSPVKGHKYFLEAASLLSKSHPEAYFLISGIPAQLSQDTISQMVADAGIAERTVILGRSDDVRELIATCDVGVVASLDSEVICRIAMEYLAMGLPVIAANTNILPEVVTHDETGIVIQAGNAAALHAAMETLIKNSEYRIRLCRQARDKAVRNFSLPSFAAKTIEHYRRFIHPANSGNI